MFTAKNIISNLLFIILPFIVSAQNVTSFQHLNIENGLSDNTINCLIQDDDGFMWIGTEDGLNRFDGKSTKVFRHSADSLSVCSNRITCAFKDKSGRLWFGGNGLMVCPAPGIFISYKHEKNNANGLTNNDITAICQDENGAMWIGTRQGLFQFDEASKKFTRFMHDTTGGIVDSYRKNRIIKMVPDYKGNLWMCTIIGLYRFSLASHEFKTYLFEPSDHDVMNGNHITALAYDKSGLLWLSVLDSGLCIFNISQEKFIPVRIPEDEMQTASKDVTALLSDGKGLLWVATTYNGILSYEPVDNTWKNYKHDIFDSKSLCDDKTLSLFEDRSGMIWTGTASRGADRLSSHPDKFESFILQPGKPGSLCENDITAACEDKNGNLWIGSKNGLMFFNRKKNTFQCYRHDGKNANSLSHNLIYSIAIDEKENLWIGTENGLNYFDPHHEKWKWYAHDEKDSSSLPGSYVFDVLVRGNGEIWAGTSSSYCRLNTISATFESEYNNSSISKFTREYYTTLFEDSRNTIWLSTSRSGVFNVDGNFNKLHSYFRSGGFDASAVHQFAETFSGNILMASDAGLFIWNCKTSAVSKIECSDEELNGDLKSVICLDDKNIWVSTSHGLFQLRLKDGNKVESIKKFSAADGLQSEAFNTSAALKLSTGEFFFGGINGFNLFRPERIIYNTTIPPVQFSSFKIFQNSSKVDINAANPSVNLAYDQNHFTFEMAALNFDHPEENQFAYQLEGFDNSMIYCGTTQSASYTNVPPGEYILHIIACNNDGLWNTEGRKLKITIVPPFWKTGWFRIMVILLLFFIAFRIYRMRIKKIKRDEEQRSAVSRQIAEARLSALSAQMNPHFIFNSLNSIQHFISESEKENALKYLSKFSKLIRLVLQNAGKNTTPVASEIEMLRFYVELESLRFSNKFSYHFDVDPGIKESTEIPSMLLQPYVENAIIHGLLNKSGPGHLEIKIKKQNDELLCIIEDNGIGRAAAAEIKNKKQLRDESLGMKLTEERMQMLETTTGRKVSIHVVDLNDESGNATGTRVEIKISIEE